MPQAVFFGMAAEDMYVSFRYRSREVNTASIGSAIPLVAAPTEGGAPHDHPRGPKSVAKALYPCRRPVEGWTASVRVAQASSSAEVGHC